jgi:putative hydrolase of the HAD superfamily
MFETLVTLFTGRIYFSDDFARDMDIPYDVYRPLWHETDNDRTTGKLTIGEAAESVLKKLGRYSPEAVEHLLMKRHESMSDTFEATPEETYFLLKELKKRGIKAGLISNCYSDERDMIRASLLMPYIDSVKLSYEQGIKKPDPKMFLDIANDLGVSPSECLYVGDGGSNELQAATASGMTAVQANWFRHLAYEPHIPCGIYPEFLQADTQADVLKYL